MRLRAGVAAAAKLAVASSAGANGDAPGPRTGFVARVQRIQPPIHGVQAVIVRGDVLLMTNATGRPFEILDPFGKPFLRFNPWRAKNRGVERRDRGGWRRVSAYPTYEWHDVRVISRGPPPSRPPGTSEQAARFVRSWHVPGRTAGLMFEIEGDLRWVPPPQSGGDGAPLAIWMGGAAFLVALSLGSVWLLSRRRA